MELNSTDCRNPLRKGSGCRADCVTTGSQCVVIELKPDNAEAMDMGEKQAKAYAQAIRNWYDRDKASLFHDHRELMNCEHDGKSLDITTRVESYKYCPDLRGGDLGPRSQWPGLGHLGVCRLILILGMQCVYRGGFVESDAKRTRLAKLVADPRWHHRFKLVAPVALPNGPDGPHFPGVLTAATLEAAARASFDAPRTENVSFSVSKKDVGDHADLFVPTGRRLYPREDDTFSANAKTRILDGEDRDPIAAAWVELQHEIVDTLGAVHGVIITATNPYVMSAERWLSLTMLDGKVMHPHPEEIESYGGSRTDLLGTKYVRRPRWGTYLRRAHVDAVGGRQKILDVVQPPVVRDVGDLLYIQLSERVSDAAAETTRDRFRAFTDLLAPITMPLRAA